MHEKTKVSDPNYVELFSNLKDNGTIPEVNDTVSESEDEPRGFPKRGPGRPRMIRTGLKGRLAKQYNVIYENEESDEENDTYHDAKFACMTEIPLKETLNRTDSDEWLQAMATELKSIIKNNTWKIVERPKDRKIIGSRVVLRNKYDGNLKERRKARIVARGFATTRNRL